MFYELISRNSKRNRKENGLFFASLVITIIAFYLILSLSHQDVMLFLAEMESDAVNKLLAMIPVFYGMTLVILFFLIYFASKYQLESRRHEFGMYLMLGMRRYKLFFLLLAEDVRGSLISIATGLPIAIVISELTSLITAKLVGLGIIQHRISISLEAIVLTTAGFILIKFIAFLILSKRIAHEEIGDLLVEKAEGSKKQKSILLYTAALILGMLLLGAAYTMAIRGLSWYRVMAMALTLLFGLAGTFLIFFGLRSVMNYRASHVGKGNKLHIFTFRQLQEVVIHKSTSMAVSSLLILAALCCFGSGVAIAMHYGNSGQRIMDYTFVGNEQNDAVKAELNAKGLDKFFGNIFDIKVGNIKNHDSYKVYDMKTVMDLLQKMPDSEGKDLLENNLTFAQYPHLISLSGYNKLLSAAGHEEIKLSQNEAAVFRHPESSASSHNVFNQILESRPEVQIAGEPYYLTGNVQSTNIVVDRAINLSFALIVQDDVLQKLTGGRYDIYTNAILSEKQMKGKSLVTAVMEVNEVLNQTDFIYESYLQNIGRQLFYVVAASYITVYLAIVFLIIANTVIGVQYLTQLQRTKRRYQTLIRIGASYQSLCCSAKKQINWYFGIPVIFGAISSIFGIPALFTGILSSSVNFNMETLMLISIAMIILLCVVEYSYIQVVKKSGNRQLLTLMTPEREE